MTTLNRSQVKDRGGRIVATHRMGEVVRQVWQTRTGELYIGDDWYSDVNATLYPIDKIPASFASALRKEDVR